MKPYCHKCFTSDPESVETDNGYTVYWFKVVQGDSSDEEELYTVGIDDNGDIDYMFLGIVDKDFNYDESFKILCPECMMEEIDDDDIMSEVDAEEEGDDEEGNFDDIEYDIFYGEDEDEDEGGYFLKGLN